MRWVIVCLQSTSSCLPVLCSNTSTLELIPIDDYVNRRSNLKIEPSHQRRRSQETSEQPQECTESPRVFSNAYDDVTPSHRTRYMVLPTMPDVAANSKTLGLRARSLDRRGLSDFPDSSLFRQSDATFCGGVTPRELRRPMTLAGKEYGSQVNECPPAPPVHENLRVGLAFWS